MASLPEHIQKLDALLVKASTLETDFNGGFSRCRTYKQLIELLTNCTKYVQAERNRNDAIARRQKKYEGTHGPRDTEMPSPSIEPSLAIYKALDITHEEAMNIVKADQELSRDKTASATMQELFDAQSDMEVAATGPDPITSQMNGEYSLSRAIDDYLLVTKTTYKEYADNHKSLAQLRTNLDAGKLPSEAEKSALNREGKKLLALYHVMKQSEAAFAPWKSLNVLRGSFTTVQGHDGVVADLPVKVTQSVRAENALDDPALKKTDMLSKGKNALLMKVHQRQDPDKIAQGFDPNASDTYNHISTQLSEVEADCKNLKDKVKVFNDAHDKALGREMSNSNNAGRPSHS